MNTHTLRRRLAFTLAILVTGGTAAPTVLAAENPLDPSAPTAAPGLPKTTTALDQARHAGSNGDVHAMMVAGVTLFNGTDVQADYDEAVRWFQKAAEAGNPYAMKNLGVAAAVGRGLPKDDAAAVGWYRKAADAGLGDAERWLAYNTQTGQSGLTADPTTAVKLYKRAVDDGYNFACNDLGFCYDHGVGVDKDLSAAAKWFRQGADGGDPAAMRNLARYLRDGTGITANAAQWRAKADAVENGTVIPTAGPAGNGAAFVGTQADLVGTWAVSGPAIHNRPTVEFVTGGSITIRDAGGSESQMGGHIWSYANGAITFNGGGSINDLDVSGTWKAQWVNATEFKTADASGNALTLDKR